MTGRNQGSPLAQKALNLTPLLPSKEEIEDKTDFDTIRLLESLYGLNPNEARGETARRLYKDALKLHREHSNKDNEYSQNIAASQERLINTFRNERSEKKPNDKL